MRVAAETAEEARHLLMHHGVARDRVPERLELFVARQLPVQQQIAGREEVRVLGELVDRVAAIEQLPLLAVDEGDRRRAVGRRGEAWIVGEAAGIAVHVADIDHVRPDRSAAHIERHRLALEAELGLALRLRALMNAHVRLLGLDPD